MSRRQDNRPRGYYKIGPDEVRIKLTHDHDRYYDGPEHHLMKEPHGEHHHNEHKEPRIKGDHHDDKHHDEPHSHHEHHYDQSRSDHDDHHNEAHSHHEHHQHQSHSHDVDHHDESYSHRKPNRERRHSARRQTSAGSLEEQLNSGILPENQIFRDLLGQDILLVMQTSQLNLFGQTFRPIFTGRVFEVTNGYITLHPVIIKMPNAPFHRFPTPLSFPMERISNFTPFDPDTRIPLS